MHIECRSVTNAEDCAEITPFNFWVKISVYPVLCLR